MARTPNTRIKVKRDVLVERLRAAREKRVANFAKLEEPYLTDAAKLVNGLATELAATQELLRTDPEKVLARIESRGYDDGKAIWLKIPRLRKPAEPKLQLGDIDRLLRVLEVADDETLSIAADDDYARFL